jgi:hypothetical protein
VSTGAWERTQWRVYDLEASAWATREARAQLQDTINTILTYLFTSPLLIFSAGITGRATITVFPYLKKTYGWRWNNR